MLGLCEPRRGLRFPDGSHARRTGCQMCLAILTTLLGGNVTLLDSFGKLAAPRFAITSETSRETLEPTMDMLPMRGDRHELHLTLSRILLLRFTSQLCNCDQRPPIFVAP